jgi:acyl-coenzyme A synthetase/AMP-(fatty) acid ligase
MQVAPAELEAILILHPAVEDAAVVPVPHTHAGEVPKAVVVRSKTHADVDETQLKDEIADFVKDSVAHYKQLAGGIDFVEQLPRSPAGKLLRRVIRQSMNGSEAGAGQVSQR